MPNVKYTLYKIENINSLLEWIKLIENSDFEFKDSSLFLNWKVVYMPQKGKDRIKFLELIFSKQKDTFFSLKEIFEHLEGISWLTLTVKESKRIYNMVDKLNKKIHTQTWIEKLFSFWKWYNEGKICRKY